MLGKSGSDERDCSFHWLEGVRQAFQVHGEKHKKRLEVCFPSGPVTTSAEVMVRLPFSEDPFYLWALLLCGEEPRTPFLSHVCSGNRVVEDCPLLQFVRSSRIRLVCRHLSDRSLSFRKEFRSLSMSGIS